MNCQKCGGDGYRETDAEVGDSNALVAVIVDCDECDGTGRAVQTVSAGVYRNGNPHYTMAGDRGWLTDGAHRVPVYFAAAPVEGPWIAVGPTVISDDGRGMGQYEAHAYAVGDVIEVRGFGRYRIERNPVVTTTHRFCSDGYVLVSA